MKKNLMFLTLIVLAGVFFMYSFKNEKATKDKLSTTKNANLWTFGKYLDYPYPAHTGTHQGDLAVGDINGDGFADVIAMGAKQNKNSTVVYVFDKATSKYIPKTDHGLPGFDAGAVVKLFKFNADNALDLIVYGKAGGITAQLSIFKIYQNNGTGIFTEAVDLGAILPVIDGTPDYTVAKEDADVKGLYNFLGFSAGALELVDLDNDNDLDIVFAATKGQEKLVKDGSDVFRDFEFAGVFLRNGNSFNLVANSGITNVHRGSMVSGDFNKDSKNDIIVFGSENGPASFYSGSTLLDTQGDGLVVGKVYFGNGNGTFTEKTNSGLQSLIDGASKTLDYNNDGILDIIITGSTGKTSDAGGGRYTQLYKGNGDGTFTSSGQTLTAMMSGDIAIGDLDLDNDIDIVIAGNDMATGRIIEFYENVNGTFTKKAITNGLKPSEYMKACDLEIADVDGDGDNDLIANGQTAVDCILVYKNLAK